MSKLRKRPVVIDAWQFTSAKDPWPEWLDEADDVFFASPALEMETVWIEIMTLEGAMRADIGDWIIRGVKNEIYPCKADIFALTYEEVPSDV